MVKLVLLIIGANVIVNAEVVWRDRRRRNLEVLRRGLIERTEKGWRIEVERIAWEGWLRTKPKAKLIGVDGFARVVW